MYHPTEKPDTVASFGDPGAFAADRYASADATPGEVWKAYIEDDSEGDDIDPWYDDDDDPNDWDDDIDPWYDDDPWVGDEFV